LRPFAGLWWPAGRDRRLDRTGLALVCSIAAHLLVALVILVIPFGPPMAPPDEAIPIELVRIGEETLRPAAHVAGEPVPAAMPAATETKPAETSRVAETPPPLRPAGIAPQIDPTAAIAPKAKPRPPKPAETQLAAIATPPPAPLAPVAQPEPGPAQSDATANTDKTSLGRPASYSVKDFIRAQVERHWNFDVRALSRGDMQVTIHIALDPDGTVTSADIVDDPRYAANPAYRELAISARDAVLVSSPLQLPPGSYYAFKDITLSFDPKEALR